ncbi:MAG: aldose epimerase family protein [Lachnospiraceae bacterium]
MIKKELFDKECDCYILSNSHGEYVKIIPYGARIVDICIKDKDGTLVDICPGYDTFEEYKKDGFSLGAVIGPYANRIKNGSYSLNGKTYQLEQNDGKNSLHSGSANYAFQMFDVEVVDNRLICTHNQKEEDGGFCANLTFVITYEFTEEGTLLMSFSGVSDCDTIFAPTQHCYFNLDGYGTDLSNHTLIIHSKEITYADAESIPNGEIVPILNTSFDFSKEKLILKDIDNEDELLQFAGGYDHNYIIDKENGTLGEMAVLKSVKTGITLRVLSDLPGMQFYSGNFLEEKKGKNNSFHQKRNSLALEPQFYPNAPNIKTFERVVLNANEKKTYHISYKFH